MVAEKSLNTVVANKGGLMYYDKDEYVLYQKAKIFNDAIRRKLGHPPVDRDEVRNALNEKMREKLTKEKLVVFEGIYGWAYAPQSGIYGTATMLTKEDL